MILLVTVSWYICRGFPLPNVKLLAEPSATLPPGSDRKKRFMVLGESAERFLPFAPKNIWENTSSELLTLQQGAIIQVLILKCCRPCCQPQCSTKIDKIDNSVSHWHKWILLNWATLYLHFIETTTQSFHKSFFPTWWFFETWWKPGDFFKNHQVFTRF